MITNYDKAIADILNAIEKQINHPYLEKHIGKPEIDEDKLTLLYYILQEADIPFAKIKTYIVTTTLVQMALDTHEIVTLSTDSDTDQKLLERQLTVLAGDYYSSLYYYILAQSNDLELIKSLANAIQQINEHKTSIYFGASEDIVFQKIAEIESLLLCSVAELAGLSHLNGITEKICLLLRLLKEKNEFLISGTSLLYRTLGKYTHAESFLKTCDVYIDMAKQHVSEEVKVTFVHPAFYDKIGQLIENHNNNKEKVLEEG